MYNVDTFFQDNLLKKCPSQIMFEKLACINDSLSVCMYAVLVEVNNVSFQESFYK